MAYNRENFIRIRRSYDGKHLIAQEAADKIRNELHEKYPELKQIDNALAETGYQLMREIALGNNGINERIDKIKVQNQQLQEDRARFLKYNGLPADITDVKYECPICGDTGFVGIKICSCMKKKILEAGYESAGILHLMQTQSFETFNSNYYSENKSWYDNIERIRKTCLSFANNFGSAPYSNLFMCGPTGLGKTHLSTSIAKIVIDNGYDVCYETAQNMFSDFQYERFSKSYNGDNSGESRTERYFDCDLLIIDDLGTEVTNQFTVACLYNIINTRINRTKSVIINTNLTREDLRKRYADRITSRLFGEFKPLVFVGRDIREMKLR